MSWLPTSTTIISALVVENELFLSHLSGLENAVSSGYFWPRSSVERHSAGLLPSQQDGIAVTSPLKLHK